MASSSRQCSAENRRRLKWLIFCRLLFSAMLLGSTIFFQLEEHPSAFSAPLLALYLLAAAVFAASCLYALMLRRGHCGERTVGLQVVLDTAFVSLIVAVTGGFDSIFNFLYLVVIIYASILLSRRSTVIVAALCCVQFGVLVNLHYLGWLGPLQPLAGGLPEAYEWHRLFYKVLVTTVASLTVAILGGYLAEQARTSSRQLSAMAERVKRVEKMAAVGELAAGLAHEIKNPLASLSGAVQLLKEEMRHDPDHQRLMDIVLREADRLSSLTSDFLLYARPPSGKARPVELERAIRDTAELFGRDNGPGGQVSLELELAAGLWIEIDPVHLRQILWNLLLNAAEATGGQGRIRIQTFAARGRQVCLRITDNGCGIGAETLQGIFDPFFTTKTNGTGLGLSIVHRILDHYGALVDVDSTPGQGSVFTVTFPRADLPN